jgi:WD40 repeat protein
MDRCVRIWDAATGESRTEFKYLAEWVDHIAIAPDGSWLATAGKNLVDIWDPATGWARPEQSRHRQWVSQLVASADGRRLLSLDHEGTVRLWFPQTGEVLRHVETGARHGPKHQPAIDPHIPRVATLAYGRVLLWDLTG